MIRLEGVGLHGGGRCAIELSRASGPTTFVADGDSASLAELSIVRADRGVCVRLGGEGRRTIDLVEHALAAIGAARVFRGLRVAVEGGEVPLLDGGARAIANALAALELAESPPPLRIVRHFEVTIDGSRYGMTPAPAPEVETVIDFAHPAIGRREASWRGDREDFLHRIAPARTFGFRSEHAALLASGRARAVDLRAVVVLDDDAVASDAFAGDDEPARHKLLDLIGDLALFGGPPCGLVRAERPGHARTHRAVRHGIEVGALVVDPPDPR